MNARYQIRPLKGKKIRPDFHEKMMINEMQIPG